MKGFGVHTSMWTMAWDPAGAERAVAAAVGDMMDFIEIALLTPDKVDTADSRRLLDAKGMPAVCSPGLPEGMRASSNPAAAMRFLRLALDQTAAIGATALTGVIYGGIGERSGLPPTEAERDNVARVLAFAAAHARNPGVDFGIEPVKRYENHILNTGRQAVEMIEKVGADTIFVHLDTDHMNIEERGLGLGILDCAPYLRYVRLSESDRGTPGSGNVRWDEIFLAFWAVGFTGGLAMESFFDMPPEVACGLAVWRPVAESCDVVMGEGLPFLRNKARQYGLI